MRGSRKLCQRVSTQTFFFFACFFWAGHPWSASEIFNAGLVGLWFIFQGIQNSIGLKTPLQQGISEPILYGDCVYKFKRIVGKPDFSDHFKKIIKRYKKVEYNLDIMR